MGESARRWFIRRYGRSNFECECCAAEGLSCECEASIEERGFHYSTYFHHIPAVIYRYLWPSRPRGDVPASPYYYVARKEG